MVAFTAIALVLAGAAGATNVSITSTPYLAGGLFTNPLLPQEGSEVTITVRASCAGKVPATVPAAVSIVNPAGQVVAQAALDLTTAENTAQATWTWSTDANGLYTVRVELDPDNTIAEENEDDNAAALTLPVTVEGRGMHFVWYREAPVTRWATCVTSTAEDAHERLTERGVLPLNWEYGGSSWSYYDKEKAKTHPEEVLAEFEELFYEKFRSDADVYGFGIDECGGYTDTWAYHASIASMKGLIRAREEKPGRVYAVWHGGGLRPGLAPYYRRAVDLLLLETYIWRALPDALGAEDVYQAIVDRVEPFVRAGDMFQPAYGNHCYTLIALDTSERPDRIDLGEQEQVVRFIRRRFPEMRGIAWYTGGYGGYGLERTEETDRCHEAVLRNADRLCLEYFVKPCVTLMRQSLWLDRPEDGSNVLTVAVSNIGGIDSGEVVVEFLVNGVSVGVQKAPAVPAGNSRSENRVFLKQAIDVQPGPHTFKAHVLSAQGATVLDSAVVLERLVP